MEFWGPIFKGVFFKGELLYSMWYVVLCTSGVINGDNMYRHVYMYICRHLLCSPLLDVQS